MQSVSQKHVDNAVVETVNLPQSAFVEDVWDIYLLVTNLVQKDNYLRHGSKENQVL